MTVEPITYGDLAVIKVNMDPSIKASSFVNVDGINYYTVAVVNGKTLFNVSGLNASIYEVNVRYGGDRRNSACNNTTTLTVNPAF